MMLTNWGAVDGDSPSNSPMGSKQSMWLKITSQWVMIILYIATLVAPALRGEQPN